MIRSLAAWLHDFAVAAHHYAARRTRRDHPDLARVLRPQLDADIHER